MFFSLLKMLPYNDKVVICYRRPQYKLLKYLSSYKTFMKIKM